MMTKLKQLSLIYLILHKGVSRKHSPDDGIMENRSCSRKHTNISEHVYESNTEGKGFIESLDMPRYL